MMNISNIKIKPTASPLTEFNSDTIPNNWAGHFILTNNENSTIEVPIEEDTAAKLISGIAEWHKVSVERLEAMSLKQYMLRVDTEFYNIVNHIDSKPRTTKHPGIVSTHIIRYTIIPTEDIPYLLGKITTIAYYPKDIQPTLTHALGHNDNKIIYKDTPVIRNVTDLYHMYRKHTV